MILSTSPTRSKTQRSAINNKAHSQIAPGYAPGYAPSRLFTETSVYCIALPQVDSFTETHCRIGGRLAGMPQFYDAYILLLAVTYMLYLCAVVQ
jgi:hypothetical protein